ncbi:MAG: Jag N-terminal domain-containing protein [Clostridia bacterium]|nr:Jag N-terminal domain-containing protein [Clostridia bacterium]
MKKVSEQMGKTVEEAIRKGLEELKVPRDDVKIEILEEPTSGGMLGMLSSKLAKVRLTVDKKIDKDEADKTINKVNEILGNIFNITNEKDTEYKFEQSENQVVLTLNSPEISHLIGYRGKTIESFQLILNSMLQKEDEEYAKIFVEINNYKKNKEEKLKEFAKKMADNVIKYRKPIKLEPMSPYERMIIHKELSLRKDVITESIGEEPRRRVMIKKKF